MEVPWVFLLIWFRLVEFCLDLSGCHTVPFVSKLLLGLIAFQATVTVFKPRWLVLYNEYKPQKIGG